MSVEWSPGQFEALKRVRDWLEGPEQVFRLFGYAGTGKTTLAKHFAASLPGGGLDVLFAAYTGKAASVLRRKGCVNAQTLHSLLYEVSGGDRTTYLNLVKRRKELSKVTPGSADEALALEDQVRQLDAMILDEREKVRGPSFRLNRQSILSISPLLVMDECSMVNEKMGQDILSFGKKVLVLGDPAQLPPVRGAGYFTRAKPDFLLDEIHRQAGENQILRAATEARESGRVLPFGTYGGGEVQVIPKDSLNPEEVVRAVNEGAQILCGKNRTRRKWNRTIRKRMGITSPYPVQGEQLVILKNDRETGVLNGVRCAALKDATPDDLEPDELKISLDYEDEVIPDLLLDKMPFDIYRNPNLEKVYNPTLHPHLTQADWGYCITVHKAQGSEWDHVILWDDWKGSHRREWLYTGITRAAKRLTIYA